MTASEQLSDPELVTTHVNQILMEAFPQIVQEGTFTRVGVQ